MKKNQTSRTNIVIIVLVIALVTAVIGTNRFKEQRKHTKIVRESRIHALMDDYFKSKAPTLFLLPSPRDISGLIAFQEGYLKKTTNALERCKNVSPFVTKVTAHFRSFKCTLFENGISKMVFLSSPGTDNATPDDKMNAHELCFFSAEDKARFRLPSRLYWNNNWNAVMIEIADWPEIVFAGMLIHELGHGYHDMVLKSASATAPVLSKSNMEEEVAMHEEEALVFNALSGGAYFRICDRIIGKAVGSSVFEILAGLELTDVQELDRCLGAERTSPQLASLLLAEHVTALCCRYADKHNLGMDAKIASYRWLVTNRL